MGCGFFVLFVGLLALVGGVGVLVWLGGRKVVAHLRQEPQALPTLAEHLIRPLLVGKEAKPEVKKVKGCVV